MDSIKDLVRSSEFDKHLRKAGGHIGKNVDEDNIPKTLNDKNE